MFKRLIKRYWIHLFTNRRPFRLTRGGWVFILYTIGVGAGAINTGNNLLYLVFGIFLGVLLASGLLSDLSLWKVHAEILFPPSAQIGQPNFIQLKLKNDKKWFPSLAITVEIEGEIRGERVLIKKFIPALSPGETYATHVVLFPLRRGWFQVHHLRFTTRFPFGLLFKWWTYKIEPRILDPSTGVVVYPEALDFSSEEALLRIRGEEQAPLTGRRGEGATIYGLRDYRNEDNPRRIHWKASAKRSFISGENTDGWLVREMEADEKSESNFWWPKPSFFQNLNPAEIESFIQFSVSLFQNMVKTGKRSRLLIPGEYGESRGGSYQIKPQWGSDRLKATFDFLSLFDGKYPVNSLTPLFLDPEPWAGRQEKGPQSYFLYELFEKWRKSSERKAA